MEIQPIIISLRVTIAIILVRKWATGTTMILFKMFAQIMLLLKRIKLIDASVIQILTIYILSFTEIQVEKENFGYILLIYLW
jgi:hypothetical protein